MTAPAPMTGLSVHLFGAATPTGEAFRQLVSSTEPSWPLHAYGRRQAAGETAATHLADLSDPSAYRPAGEPGAPAVWVSFAPIWLLAPFLEQLAREAPQRLEGLRGVIACSSSSVLTKRFAANPADRALVDRLSGAETMLLSSCRRLRLPCRILQPTLIYGRVGPYADRNLSRLLQLMRRLPLLPLPAHSGLRQPIHASQLAAVAWEAARRIAAPGGQGDAPAEATWPERLALGGDDQLSYRAMLQALQRAQPAGDPARRCRLVPIPDRLFILLAAPLLLRSPRAFEAILRMGADLAGFTPAHRLLERPAQPFPMLPLA